MASIDAFKSARQTMLECRGDPQKAYQTFKWPELDQFNWALEWFDDYAKDNNQPALWIVDEDGSEEKTSFEQMRVRSNQVANYLREQGVKRGDRLLLMLDNVTELWETMLASIKLGALMIPATTLASGKELEDRITRGKATYVVTDGKYVGQFPDIISGLTRIAIGQPADGWLDYSQAYKQPKDFTPEGVTRATDPMLLYFTSGTTSLPKLVLHTHQSYPVGSLTTMYWLGLEPGDIHLNISSPGWAKHAWSCFFAPWDAGATIFIYRSQRFSAEGVLSALANSGVTSLCAPPTVWRMLIQKDMAAYDVKLKGLSSAGEPLNPEVIKHVEEAWGLTIREGYGQTETTALVAMPKGTEVRFGSMGKPLPGYQLALLDPDGNEASEGEVALNLGTERPLGLMQEYSDDPERSAAAIHDGYYRTGDVARRDEDGYYWYVGRADDVFKSSDYRISPFELESILIEHEAVAEAAVVAAPDEQRLNIPKAYVVLREGHEPGKDMAQQIFAFTREHMSPYKRIRLLEFAQLPKTISGKIRRVELRAHAAGKEQGELVFAESEFF